MNSSSAVPKPAAPSSPATNNARPGTYRAKDQCASRTERMDAPSAREELVQRTHDRGGDPPQRE